MKKPHVQTVCAGGLLSILLWVGLLLFGIAFLAMSIYNVFFELREGELLPSFLWMVFSSAIIMFALFLLNQEASVVWVEDRFVKRRGLFCGYKKECAIDSIQKVEMKYFGRSGNCICLINESTDGWKWSYKNYICFHHSKKNIAFLRIFWQGEIDDKYRI